MSIPQSAPQPAQGPKKLVRTRDDKWVSGVCGGLGRYFGVDANLVRLLMVVAFLFSCGTALVAYAVAWALMPEE